MEVEYILGKSSLLLSASKLSIDSHYLNLLNNLRLQSSVIAFILWGRLFQQQCVVLSKWALSFNPNILLEWEMLRVWMWQYSCILKMHVAPNIDKFLPQYLVSHPRRCDHSSSLSWELQNSHIRMRVVQSN